MYCSYPLLLLQLGLYSEKTLPVSAMRSSEEGRRNRLFIAVPWVSMVFLHRASLLHWAPYLFICTTCVSHLLEFTDVFIFLIPCKSFPLLPLVFRTTMVIQLSSFHLKLFEPLTPKVMKWWYCHWLSGEQGFTCVVLSERCKYWFTASSYPISPVFVVDF